MMIEIQNRAMEKKMMDFTVVEAVKLHRLYTLLKLQPADSDASVPAIAPGQFVQVAIPRAPHTFLRRPISVNFYDRERRELWLLVRRAGEGTSILADLEPGEKLNIILPLGNTFSLPVNAADNILLVGGGVGVAPMLYFGHCLRQAGYKPRFLVGARSKDDLLQLDEFRAIGETYVSTDDGSAGEHGLVTQNSVLKEGIDRIYCCGPAPMMKAVAKEARRIGAECEVSLENMMACGLGACLCCVEKTVKGNVCVCTEGPVFNINQLTWQI